MWYESIYRTSLHSPKVSSSMNPICNILTVFMFHSDDRTFFLIFTKFVINNDNVRDELFSEETGRWILVDYIITYLGLAFWFKIKKKTEEWCDADPRLPLYRTQDSLKRRTFELNLGCFDDTPVSISLPNKMIINRNSNYHY